MVIQCSVLQLSFASTTFAWIIRKLTHVSESSMHRPGWTQLRVPCAMWSRSSAPGHERLNKWQESSSIMLLAWNQPLLLASYHYRRRFVNMLSVLSHRSEDMLPKIKNWVSYNMAAQIYYYCLISTRRRSYLSFKSNLIFHLDLKGLWY